MLEELEGFAERKKIERKNNSLLDYAGVSKGEGQSGGTPYSSAVSPKNAKVQVQGADAEKIFFDRLRKQGVNLDELEGILRHKGSALINSCAGSGKTTAMVLKIIHDFVTGESLREQEMVTVKDAMGNIVPGGKRKVQKRILVSTFLKSGAEELRSSLREWCKKLSIVGLTPDMLVIKTLHAEFYDVIRGVSGAPLNIVNDTSKYIREVAKEFGIRGQRSYSRSLTKEEIKDLECILTYARNRVDNSKYAHPLMVDYGITETLLDMLLISYKMKKQLDGVIDYEDLQEMLYASIQKNPKLRDYLGSRYDIIYLDEFQDTAQLQYELLKCYFDKAEKVIAIGDDDQCIYSWRGSDNDIIGHRFEDEYHPDVMTLTTNYRCRGNILQPVVSSIMLNRFRHEKRLRAYKDGGEVFIRYNKSVNDLLQSVYADVSDGKTVGILGRTNYDLLAPAIILELAGTVAFATSKQVNMEGNLPRWICGGISLINKRYTPDFESILSLFVDKYNAYEAHNLCSTLNANVQLTLYTMAERDIKYSAPSLAMFILNLRKARKDSEIAAYLYYLKALQKTAFTGDSQFAKRARDLCILVTDLITNSEQFKGLSLDEIDRVLNVVLPKRLKDRALEQKGDVRLVTVHEAKGKEWDSVYIWNDADKVFPAGVGKRELTPQEYEEERRIHYIAWTRAKDKLTVYTTRGMESPFLDECDLSSCNISDRGKPSVVDFVKAADVVIAEGQDEKSFIDNYVTKRALNLSEGDTNFVAKLLESRMIGQVVKGLTALWVTLPKQEGVDIKLSESLLDFLSELFYHNNSEVQGSEEKTSDFVYRCLRWHKLFGTDVSKAVQILIKRFGDNNVKGFASRLSGYIEIRTPARLCYDDVVHFLKEYADEARFGDK